MTNYRVGGDASRVVQTHRKPGHRCLVLLCEIMPHYRLEALPYTSEAIDHFLGLVSPLFGVLPVAPHEFLAELVERKICGPIPTRTKP